MKIRKIAQEEAENMLDQNKVTARMPKLLLEKFEALGWRIDEYYMEKEYKGYLIVIEFCIGDFCVYPCTKETKQILEQKRRVTDFMHAYVISMKIEGKIDKGQFIKATI